MSIEAGWLLTIRLPAWIGPGAYKVLIRHKISRPNTIEGREAWVLANLQEATKWHR
jgi:hypothetical protein